MTNSILQERSFDELISLYKYFEILRSDSTGATYNKFDEILEDINEIILDKYMFEASNYYNHNSQPDN